MSIYQTKQTLYTTGRRLVSAFALVSLALGPLAQPSTLAAPAVTPTLRHAAQSAPAAAPPPAAVNPPTNWVFQGPAPQVNAQQDLVNVAQADENVSGAVTAIAANPANPDLVYIGTANGGVWKTTNATAATPNWLPLTDQLQSQSIGVDAVTFDPTDPTSQTVVVGTGRFSGYAQRGDDVVGIYYTTNGGTSWTVSSGTGNNLTQYSGNEVNIAGVVARGNTLLAATSTINGSGWVTIGGLFRTTTGPGGTWTKISGSGGLPNVAANFIVGDPANPNVLYVGFLGASGGIFKSTDLGATWSNISSGITAFSANTTALKATVFNNGTTNVVTVVMNGAGGSATGYALFRSVNGAAFTALDVPLQFKDAYGAFGITADKTNANVVYVSGGYIIVANGPFQASVNRVDASQPSGSQTTLLYGPAAAELSSSMTASQTFAKINSTVLFPTSLPFNLMVDSEQMSVTGVMTATGYYTLTVTRGVNGTTPATHSQYAVAYPPQSPKAYGAPHVDVNSLSTDAGNGLLMGSHGGLFRLPQPGSAASATNYWVSKNGSLGTIEMHDVAYDSVANVLIGGNQDNAVVYQSAPGNLAWPIAPSQSGDGGDVAVDNLTLVSVPATTLAAPIANSTATTLTVTSAAGFPTPIKFLITIDSEKLIVTGIAGNILTVSRGALGSTAAAHSAGATVTTPPQSIRYGSSQTLGGFRNQVYTTDNVLVSNNAIAYANITDGQFTTPLALNAVDPKRFLVGGSANLYESLNMGNTILQIAPVGVNQSPGPMAYGGRRNGVDNPDVFYVGFGSSVYARTVAGGAVQPTAALPAGASTLRDIALNAADWMNVFVVDDNQVFASTDGGATWADITGGLFAGLSSGDIRMVEFVSGAAPYIAVGTRSGVFASRLSNLGAWVKLGAGFPDVLVYDLAYDATDNVLVASTLGRGAWLLPNASNEQFALIDVAPVVSITSGATTATESGTYQNTYNFSVVDPGDRFTVSTLNITGGTLVTGSLSTVSGGGSFNVIFPDGPVTATISLRVTDSTGLVSNLATRSVAVANAIPTSAILGAPTSGAVGTPVSLGSSVTDASPVDMTAGFTYLWFVYKPAGAAAIPNGTGASFSYTPTATGVYTVYMNATDINGGLRQVSKVINAASPDLTENSFMVTVNEGQTATNTGTYSHRGASPLGVSTSIGTLTPTQTLFWDDFNNEPVGGYFTSITHWYATAGDFDVDTFYGAQGQGRALDMDGSVPSNATIRTRTTFMLIPGTYELSFKIGSNPFGGGNNALHYTLGPALDASTNASLTLTTIVRQFVVTTTQTAPITFAETGPVDGGGSVLDDVKLVRVNSPFGQPQSLNVVAQWQLGEDDPGAVIGQTGNAATLGRDTNGLAPALNLSRTGSPTYAALTSPAAMIYDSFSSAGATAAPTVPNLFTITNRLLITSIFNWHSNSSFPGGQNAASVSGTITILDYPSGAVRGAWDATGSAGWTVEPNITLPPGTYRISETQTGPSSWSYTTVCSSCSGQWAANKGLTQITAAPAAPDNGSVKAMSFNGSTDSYVLAAPVTTATDNFGIEAWVRLNSTANQIIVYNGNTSTSGFGLMLNSGRYQVLYGSVGVFDSGVAATLGVWQHIALVHESGVLKIYINGTPAITTAVSSPNAATSGFAIARAPETPASFVNGAVDEVRVFTFAPGTFDPADLSINTSVSGNWYWTYTLSDGPANSQEVAITATTGVSGDASSIPFLLTVNNVAPTATFNNGGAVNEGSAGTVAFSAAADVSTADAAAGFHYAYDFDNDGVFDLGDGTYAGSVLTASATVPADFLVDGPGSQTVHGRILDKDDGYTDYTTALALNNAAPTAAVSGPATGLESQLLTFLLEATDPSTTDQEAGFAYNINWGDGSPAETLKPVVGSGDTTARHAYATAGNYTVQVTATDKDGATSAAATASVTVNAMTTPNLQALFASTAMVYLTPANDAALQNEITVINGLATPATPVSLTIILGAGPYTGLTLNSPSNLTLAVAGNTTRDTVGTQMGGATSGLAPNATAPALTVSGGEVIVQGLGLSTDADAPTVLVTGGHLVLGQSNVQESTAFNNVAIKVTGGSANLGFDLTLNVNGEGAFVSSYARSALVPHPDGIDAELSPNTFQVGGATIRAAYMSSTGLTSSPAPYAIGQQVTFTATISVNAAEHGHATGSVTFMEGTTVLGTGTVNRIGNAYVATLTTTALSTGVHTVRALYNGDEAYLASSAEITINFRRLYMPITGK